MMQLSLGCLRFHLLRMIEVVAMQREFFNAGWVKRCAR